MENFLALAIVGLLVVVPPDESLHSPAKALYPDAPGNLLHSTKQAAQAIVCDRPPCPPTALDSFAHGVQKTADGAREFVTDRIGAAKESVGGAYHHVKTSIHDTAQKAKHGAHETLEKAKHGIHGTAEKAASYIPFTQRPGSHADDLDPAAYVMPGIPQAVEDLKRKVDDGGEEASPASESSPAPESLMNKVEQALSRKETASAPSHIQDKVHGAEQGAGDVVGDAKSMVDDGREDCRGKVGAFLHGLKEKLLRTAGRDDTNDGMDMKVQELCSILGDRERSADGSIGHEGEKYKGSALHESYDYLRVSALKAIDEAKEVYIRSIEGEGAKWKEKYGYLAETAKSAVEGAKEIFDRAVIVPATDKQEELPEFIGKHAPAQHAVGNMVSRVKHAAVRAKQRVLATSRSLVRTLYLASFSTAFGVSLWMTFFSGYVLSHVLPRQQLALVQSKLFPIYLRMVTGCLAVCTVGHLLLHPWSSANWLEHLQQWNLTLALALTLCNTIVVEPKVTKVMFEKMKVEKEEGRGQSADAPEEETLVRLASIDTKFRGLHQVASLGNLVIMGGLSWHLWYLANRLLV